MAGVQRPSFLKRQKEQARLTRAAEKRAAKQARREAKAAGVAEPETFELLDGQPEAPAGDEPQG